MAELGATPLKHIRLESFAKLVALEGKTQADAWAQSTNVEISFESASNGGSRAMRRKPVMDRIAWLRKERAQSGLLDAKSPVSADPLAIMATVSDVLKQSYITAKKEGFPAAKLAMVRKAWSMHVGRFSALNATRKPIAESSSIETVAFWKKVGGCECHR